jgi:hypothetical protein
MRIIETGDTHHLVDWLVAIGTIGAVVVALFANRTERLARGSRVYFDEAARLIQSAFKDFTDKRDSEGRPLSERVHWLNFARGVATAKSLAEGITTDELREVWREVEQYWRIKTYDELAVTGDSFPEGYYGYVGADRSKNFVTPAGEKMALSDKSLRYIYRWVKWPKDRLDPVTDETPFTDDELESMDFVGPRGLAAYVRNNDQFRKDQRDARTRSQQAD